MQFQVPQFIETEDKLVGPFTLKQFIYVGAAGAVSTIFFFILNTWLWAVLSAVIVGGAVGIAFVKIQGRPLINVILSAFNFYWKPQTYVWQPEHPELPKQKAVKIPAGGALPFKKQLLGDSLEKVAAGVSLHKSWEVLQTGEKMSGEQFVQNKMAERYQIFQKLTGERRAARRVDYR